MSGKGIWMRHMTVGVSKNWLVSIWDAAVQHLLLTQLHQKLPYSHRNGYNPFPMTLGVTLHYLPGYSALWKSSAVLASSQAWSMASRIRAYRAGSLALGCSTTDKPYSRHSLSDAARNSAYWLRRCSYFLPST